MYGFWQIGLFIVFIAQTWANSMEMELTKEAAFQGTYTSIPIHKTNAIFYLRIVLIELFNKELGGDRELLQAQQCN